LNVFRKKVRPLTGKKIIKIFLGAPDWSFMISVSEKMFLNTVLQFGVTKYCNVIIGKAARPAPDTAEHLIAEQKQYLSPLSVKEKYMNGYVKII
jgi:hypothetical protein